MTMYKEVREVLFVDDVKTLEWLIDSIHS